MKTTITLFISIILLTITAVAEAKGPRTKNVNVVNTPDVNVVSMPPIEANITGPIEATITYPVEVIVNEMPGVMIDNGPSNPVPVVINTAKREAIKIIGLAFFGAGGAQNIARNTIYTVPLDKILVVETISGSASAPTGEEVARMRIYSGQSRVYIPLREEPTTVPGLVLYHGTISARAYFLPGEVLTLYIERTGTSPALGGSASVFGYLVPSDSVSLSP